ncbi:phage minor head protein [Coralloluteibacterium thermophilus]|uniref:Phage minor head protein n=1 Tax=Coralloluteibacterium thermophilum TaxID=2707049 RepID=A0ABV9NPU5_9GAMM
MAKRLSRREWEQLAMRLEPEVREAFLRAVSSIRGDASARMVEELLRSGRGELITEALGINAARFSSVAEAIRAAYLQGGLLSALEIPPLLSQAPLGGLWRPSRGYRVAFNFDITNPQAESWLRERSSQLVTRIVSEQRETIRITLAEGMAAGRNPRQTALDIVGRVGETGRRSGGVVGLTPQQAQFVANARGELADPERMARYFSRERRDKRFDATVRKAMREGRPLSPAQIDKITGRYADRLLQLRGEAIARTETLTGMSAAREEAYRQAIEAGDLDPRNVIGTWGATGDSKTRDSHAAMDGQERPFGQPFVTPSGALMRYPGDTELGAGVEETIQCRCMKRYRINYAAEAQRVQR